MPIHLKIVTAEREVFADDVDMVSAPTRDGRVGILPRHTPLLSILTTGELGILKGGVRTPFAVSGGFMQVLDLPTFLRFSGKASVVGLG
ncbi:MAG: hypothetical protein EI684_20700, partial [Candidatus Viridilinea halotolerans]